MAMPVIPRIFRRGSPNLHRAFGQHWPAVLEAGGSFYLGDNSRWASQRVNLIRPNRILAINRNGQATAYSNACLHNGKRLITPKPGLWFEERETLQCAWHNSTYRADCGRLIRPGAMKIPLALLPETECPKSEVFIWQDRLVFELGNELGCEAHRARQTLERALGFISEEAGDVFDFRDYELQVSLVSPQVADALSTLVNYLDIRHLGNHADTLGRLVNLADYTHAANDACVIQRMGLNPLWLEDSDSEWVREYHQSGLPCEFRFGAVWAMTADGLMLERYPGVIVVSQCLPHPDDPWCADLHHDFYYHSAVSPEFIRAHQRVFSQTGTEDDLWCAEATDHLADRIADGRGDEEWGFLDPEQENYARWLYDIADARLMPANE